MPSTKLTDTMIANLRCDTSKQKELRDSLVPGLTIRVSPRGTKSFYLIYRFEGKAKRLTLGRYGILSLAGARKKAKKLLGQLADGKDPATILKGSTARTDPLTFGKFVDEYIEKYASVRTRRWRETQRILTREFVTRWRDREIHEIDKREIIRSIDEIVSRGSPASANRAFAHLRAVFNWAVDRSYLERSPMERLKMPAPEKTRERVLSKEELLTVWHAAETMGYPYGFVIQLLILTGQRREEVASMRWEDLDLEGCRWSIPGEMNKSNRLHVVPLSEQCIELISRIPRIHPKLVFPARGRDVPVSGFSKWKRRLDEICGVENWTVHDIRRSVATGLASENVEPHIIRRIMKHVDPSVTAIYNKYSYLPEMAAALDAWSKKIIEEVRTRST